MEHWITYTLTPDLHTGIVIAVALILIVELLDRLEAQIVTRKRSK